MKNDTPYTDITNAMKEEIAFMEEGDFINRITNATKVITLGAPGGANCFGKVDGMRGAYNFAQAPKEAMKWNTTEEAEAQAAWLRKRCSTYSDAQVTGLGDAWRARYDSLKKLLPTFEAMAATVA